MRFEAKMIKYRAKIMKHSGNYAVYRFILDIIDEHREPHINQWSACSTNFALASAAWKSLITDSSAADELTILCFELWSDHWQSLSVLPAKQTFLCSRLLDIIRQPIHDAMTTLEAPT